MLVKLVGPWLSLVERLVRDEEAASSNLAGPTISFSKLYLSGEVRTQFDCGARSANERVRQPNGRARWGEGHWDNLAGPSRKEEGRREQLRILRLIVNCLFLNACSHAGEGPNLPGFMERLDGRGASDLREVVIEPGVAPHAHGSVLIRFGRTQVICAATLEESVPRWMREQGGEGGWITAEYSMLPYSTLPRKPRDITKGRPDGRGTEIQRLIGRSLRAAVDLVALGQRTLWVDCDVLQADGGTRTAAITGACVAMELACRTLIDAGKLLHSPLKRRVAAVSVGVVGGEALLDLNYEEDKAATVDMNLVMTNQLEFVEVQGSGEEAVFSGEQLAGMLGLGKAGILRLLEIQDSILIS
jgi:ribonuclease PH